MTDQVEPVTTAYAAGNLQQPLTGDVERAELEQRVRAQVADEQAAWLPELLHVVWGFAMGEHTGTAQLTPAHAEEALRHVPGAILDAAAVHRTTPPAGPVATDDAAENPQGLTVQDVERIADDALRSQFKPLIQQLVDDQLMESAAAIEAAVRAQVAKEYEDLLASIALHIQWHHVTRNLTTDQKDLFADALERHAITVHGPDGEDPCPEMARPPSYAPRWWRENHATGPAEEGDQS